MLLSSELMTLKQSVTGQEIMMINPYRYLLIVVLILITANSDCQARTNQWLRAIGSGVELWTPHRVEGESVVWHGGNTANGLGIAIWRVDEKETERASGIWKNGKLNTVGVWIHSEGDRYEGDWLNGKKHGYGVYTWPDGSYYCGSYAHDKRSGGIVYKSNGDVQGTDTPSATLRDYAFKAEASAVKARETAAMARQKMIINKP
jgi:hypothetical protein